MTPTLAPPSPSTSSSAGRRPEERAVGRHLEGCLGRPLEAADWERPLDSFGLAEDALLPVLLAVEDDLGVALENEDLRPDRMRSPAALADLFAARRAARGPAPRRIVHVTSEFLPHVSGPARNIWSLCHHLADGFDHVVYSFDLSRDLPDRDVRDGVKVSRFAIPRFTDLLRLRRRTERMAGHPELDPEVDANLDMPSSDVLRELARSGADAIVSRFYAGILGRELVDFFPSKRWLLVPSFFQPPGSRQAGTAWWDPARADKVMFYQELDVARALDYGMRPDQLTWAPMPIETDEFRPLGGERDRETLLYVGRLTRNKGVVAFLEVFRRMVEVRPSLRFRIVADLDSPSPIEQAEARRLRETVERLDLADRVILAGRLEGEDLVRAYSTHAIHVLPSIGDCYSKVTAEALACGMNCVNLELPGYEWQRAVDGGEPLVHLVSDLDELGRTVLDLLERDELPSHRDYVVRTMGWEALKDAYVEFLHA